MIDSHIARLVQIDVAHGQSRINADADDPVIAMVLRQVLEYPCREFVEGGPVGYREIRQTNDCWGPDLQNRPLYPTRLTQRVRRWLEEHGWTVHINDLREFGPRVAIDRRRLSATEGPVRRLAMAVRKHTSGQIAVSNTRELIHQMSVICWLLPKARVLIPVARRKHGWLLRRNLQESLGMEVGLKTERWRARDQWPQYLVTTWQPINSCEAEDWDLLLLPDAMTAVQAGYSGARARLAFHPHRCYAFVRSQDRLGCQERMRLESIVGPMIYDVRACPEVRVLWLRTPDCRSTEEGQRSLEWKRQAYWKNERRNDYVAAVARAFADGNWAKLQKYGVPFRDGTPAIPNADGPTVVVLVESVEHGRELVKRMDGWLLLQAAPGQPQMNRCTTVMAGTQYGLQADVLVRATGGSGTEMLQPFPGRSRNPDVPALLVDFADHHDRLAREDLRWRHREYEFLGWQQVHPLTNFEELLN